MLDKFITPVIKPLLTPIVATLHKLGITADQLTVAGFLVGMLALPLLAFELWYGALAVIILNRIFDGLDGAMARYAQQSSSAGGYLDITLDFLFYAAVPLGFILANPAQNAIAGALLVLLKVPRPLLFLSLSVFGLSILCYLLVSLLPPALLLFSLVYMVGIIPSSSSNLPSKRLRYTLY